MKITESCISPVYFDLERERVFRTVWRQVGREEDSARRAETYAMFLRSHGYDFSCEDDDSFRLRWRLSDSPMGR